MPTVNPENFSELPLEEQGQLFIQLQGIIHPDEVSPQPESLPTIKELGRQWGSFWKKESTTQRMRREIYKNINNRG